MSTESEKGIQQPIIFLDGMCAMCNRFVDLVLRADSRGVFRFSPLQGDTASDLLPSLPPDPRDWSMIYVNERGVHSESDASLEVYRRLGGIWWPVSLARLVPRWIRNPIYRVIAQNRYRWFGTRDSCRVPTEDQRDRFLP